MKTPQVVVEAASAGMAAAGMIQVTVMAAARRTAARRFKMAALRLE